MNIIFFRWWIYGMLKEKYLNADEKFEKLLYKTGMIIGVLLIAVLCIIEMFYIL